MAMALRVFPPAPTRSRGFDALQGLCKRCPQRREPPVRRTSAAPAGSGGILVLRSGIEQAIDLGDVGSSVGPVAQPDEVAAVAPDDLAQRPAVEDPEVEHRTVRTARSRTGGPVPERLRPIAPGRSVTRA